MTDPTPPPPKTRSLLAVATAILAVVLILSLGFCGYTMGHSNLENMPASGGFELVGIVGSILGLVVVGIIAIIRSIRRSS